MFPKPPPRPPPFFFFFLAREFEEGHTITIMLLNHSPKPPVLYAFLHCNHSDGSQHVTTIPNRLSYKPAYCPQEAMQILNWGSKDYSPHTTAMLQPLLSSYPDYTFYSFQNELCSFSSSDLHTCCSICQEHPFLLLPFLPPFLSHSLDRPIGRLCDLGINSLHHSTPSDVL